MVERKRFSALTSVAMGDDPLDELRRDRLDIGGVGHLRVGHDGGGVRIDQDDPVAFRLQRLAGLNPGIVELARLADDDRAGADDEDGLDVAALGHGSGHFRRAVAGA